MSLRIFVTADPELPVPPRLYGGIERVIELLVNGLVRRGHDVTLFAHRDSRVPCRLVPYSGDSSRDRWDSVTNAVRLTREVLRVRPDVVQSFGRLAYLAPILPMSVPKVMSYQREITPSRVRWAATISRGSLQFTGCSRKLIEPMAGTGSWRAIYNAVPIERFAFAPSVRSDAPLVFLGRVEAIKGPHLAIDVARRTGRHLVIAGNVPEGHEEFFEREIRPWIDGRIVSYIGPVDDAAKSTLLGEAAALLMPVLWDEPFGIVMAEALACGTPVIGLSRGAVPEVIDDGVTGFVCENVEGMAESVARIAAVSRAACRRAAEDRFSPATLVHAYEALYTDITASRRPHAGDAAPSAAREYPPPSM